MASLSFDMLAGLRADAGLFPPPTALGPLGPPAGVSVGSEASLGMGMEDCFVTVLLLFSLFTNALHVVVIRPCFACRSQSSTRMCAHVHSFEKLANVQRQRW